MHLAYLSAGILWLFPAGFNSFQVSRSQYSAGKIPLKFVCSRRFERFQDDLDRDRHFLFGKVVAFPLNPRPRPATRQEKRQLT
jgi:hypothetical protein